MIADTIAAFLFLNILLIVNIVKNAVKKAIINNNILYIVINDIGVKYTINAGIIKNKSL